MTSRLLFLCGAAIIAAWLAAAISAPWLAPHDPLASFTPLLPPGSPGFVLGTDLLGRDILSRLIWGARPVVTLSLAATVIAYVVGTAAGLVAGFRGGRTDSLLSFLSNILLSFPVLVLYLVIIVALGASAVNVVIAVAVGTTPLVFRIVRDLARGLAGRDFVTVAVTQGEAEWRILWHDILPNAAPALVNDFCLRLGYGVMMVGALGFLGLGLPPPAPDWGGMITDGRALAFAFPYLVLFPCLALVSLVLALSLVADNRPGAP
ncbi:ABC transporter permease [Polymorphobacter fuscus]|uniref:ABC transporter permease n=1 Tax=Sandarakinorhabdus fusca TaxID=1439888 RepID=UPI0016BB7228|nr:ABC transporter permease [Polymorphobacter fuscus]NJC07499.1 peptide/nickel transport system permease protein [Polymorphobacter fuscus]